MKHTILHASPEAAAAFEDALRKARGTAERLDRANRRAVDDSQRRRRAWQAHRNACESLVDLLLAAAVVSSDDLDAAEAMLHGMRLAVPQDEMGS